jgi:hypothetical protein
MRNLFASLFFNKYIHTTKFRIFIVVVVVVRVDLIKKNCFM